MVCEVRKAFLAAANGIDILFNFFFLNACFAGADELSDAYNLKDEKDRSILNHTSCLIPHQNTPESNWRS